MGLSPGAWATAATVPVLKSGTDGMWHNCPAAINADPNVYAVFYEDFQSFHSSTNATSLWNFDTGATAGTVVLGNASDANTPNSGFITLATSVTDNDFAFLRLGETNSGAGWNFAASGLKTWFEVAIMVSSVTDVSYYAGLCEETVIKCFADDTGAETIQDGIYFRTLTATPTEVDFCINQNTTETEIAGNADTLATNTAIRFGWFTDGTTMTPYYDGVAGTTTTHAAGNFPTDQSLTPFFGVLSGSAGAKSLHVIYIKIVQMRA